MEIIAFMGTQSSSVAKIIRISLYGNSIAKCEGGILR